MNSSIRLANSIIQHRHHDAEVARRARFVGEQDAEPRRTRRFLGLRSLLAPKGRKVSLRPADLRSEL